MASKPVNSVRLRRSVVSVALAIIAVVGLSCGFADYGDTASAGRPTQTVEQELRVCGADKYGGPQGADVSYYQGNFDWAAQKRAGMKFGIARISDGTGFEDPKFAYNWAELKRLGMVRGAYQFFRGNQSATAQANLVVQKVGRLGPGDLPVVADVEQANGQSAATMRSKLHTWLRIVEQGTGKKPMIYTAAYFWDTHVGDSSLGDYPLWVANWGPSCPSLPNGWSDWAFWQYCDGQAQYCTNAQGFDRDVFNGSVADLDNFAGGSGGGDIPIKVKWDGLGNPDTDEPSKAIADAFPGDTFKANITITNDYGQALEDVEIDYLIEEPYIHATDYTIFTDWPAKDKATWKVNDSDSNPANPAKDQMGAHGTLGLYAMAAGETKRVEITLKADRGSIGFIDHPDVRAWVHHISNVYGEASGWNTQPTNANPFDHLLRSYAQADILTRDHWQFNSAYEKDFEGWSNCSGANIDQFKINSPVECLALHAADADSHICSPGWTAIDADTYDQMVLRMRAHDGEHSVAVYWAGADDSYAEERVVRFSEVGDDNFNTLVIPLARHQGWVGNVTKLRIDPLDGGAPAADDSGWYDIDKIFFQSSATQQTSSPDDEFVDQAPVSLDGFSEPPGSDAGGTDAGSGGADAGNGPDVGAGSDAGTDGSDAGANSGTSLSGKSGCACESAPGGPSGSASIVLAMLAALMLAAVGRRRGSSSR